jgi:recombinational DNA repair protein RecT
VNTPLGQAYLIPRKKNDRNGQFLRWECNLQIGYQGALDLCYRYGKYKMITAEVVYDGDYFDYRYGTRQFLDHRPEGRNGAKPTHVWALYQLENGGERFVVWTWDEALAHGEKFSDSWNKDKPWSSPWLSSETAQEEMAKKSVLKALLKYAPKSVEGQIEAALCADGHAIVAEKFEDTDGKMKLAFDVKQIAAPDTEMQDFMNKVNGKPEEEEVEPVPINRGKSEEPVQKAIATPRPQGDEPVTTRNTPLSQSDGTAPRRGTSLFPADEAQDIEGVEPPNFQ